MIQLLKIYHWLFLAIGTVLSVMLLGVMIGSISMDGAYPPCLWRLELAPFNALSTLQMTIHASLSLFLLNQLTNWNKKLTLAQHLREISKKTVWCSILYFGAYMLIRFLLMQHIQFSLQFLPYLAVGVVCKVIADYIEPQQEEHKSSILTQLLIDWVTYEDEENKKEK